MDKTILSLAQIQSPYAQRLRRNILMDLPGFTCQDPLADKHGNNVSEDCLRLLLDSYDDCVDDDIGNICDRLQKSVYTLHKDNVDTFFLSRHNAHNKRPAFPKETTFVRYISKNRFHRLCLVENNLISDPVSLDKATTNQKRDLQSVNAYLRAKNLRRKPNVDTLKMGNSESEFTEHPDWLPKPLWVVPASQAPHRAGGFDDLDANQRARKVIQELALPGFESQIIRTDTRWGLIAIEFTLQDLASNDPVELFKPTVLDALDNSFFLPGPTHAAHGYTDQLNEDLTEPMGIRTTEEYICRDFTVPVKIKDQIQIIDIGDFED